MIWRLFSLLLLLLALPAPAEEPTEFEMEMGDKTVTMKRYFCLIYLRGDKAGDFSEEELEEIQKGHMAHITRMSEEGIVQLSGPFADDGDKRGLLIFDVPTIEEVENWSNQDPAVKVGRLKYEIHPWWGAKGSQLK